MTPRLVSRDTELPSAVDASRDPARCQWFAVGLFTAGVVTGAVLIASGQPLPTLAPVLLLAVLFAFAVHRVALFPSELAVTAEAAVLLAAIVALRDNGPLVGPWCIALLAGPLDLVHWRQRSFVRMTYNAGNRMAATLAGATIFAIAIRAGAGSPFGHGAGSPFGHGAGGSSRAALVGAALVASVAFAVVEGAVGTVLVRLRDGGWLDAARVELPMELLTVPLGMIGASAGYLATEVGWWAAVAVLAPTLFLPELAIIRARRARFPFTAASAATVGSAAAALMVVAVLVPSPAASTLGALGVVALLAGLELRVDRSVPPVVAALVAAAVVVGGEHRAGVAALVAVGTVATGCVVSRGTRWWLPLLAGVAALAAAAVYDAHPSRSFALCAALTFALLVGSRPSGVVWTAPLVCAAVSFAYVWRALGAPGALVFVAGFVASVVVTALFGAPPWRSRLVGPWAAGRGVRAHRLALVVIAVLSMCLGIVSCATADERVVPATTTAAAAAVVASMAMSSVRQWRFAPRRRARDATLLLASVLTAVVVYPPIALDGNEWSIAILAVGLIVPTAIAWPLARLASAAAPVGRSAGSAVVNR